MKAGREILVRWDAPINNIKIFGDTSDTTILNEMSTVYHMPAFQAWKYDKDTAIAQLAEVCRNGQLVIPKSGKIADEFDQIVYKRDEDDNITPELDEVFHPDIMMALLYASRQMFYDWGIDITVKQREAVHSAIEEAKNGN
jgi:hypothetical protein